MPGIENEEPKVVDTAEGAQDGQEKCPKCGATDISLNTKTGKLRCNYCRFEFEPIHFEGMETDISHLEGETMGSGTHDIEDDAESIVTLKCSSCGAEVVIDTSEVTQARCHWCRNTLSLNQKVPNGAIPDVVLPFSLSKDQAKAMIENFVGRRRFFASPKFKKEFTTENVMGVYFPYMIVDINSHASFHGQAERTVRSYIRREGDHTVTYYDADLYEIDREFDLTIDGLTVESSSDKLNTRASDKTTNIINSIMPFDTENSVKWNANYLKGFTSEKRDTNVDQLRPIVSSQARDIARYNVSKTISEYDRGVKWEKEDVDMKGKQWKAAYLPVWLYSYLQTKGGQSTLHYVAVNGRTKETMGSVPINMPRLLLITFLIELLGAFLAVYTYNSMEFQYSWLFILPGIIYFIIIYSRYRNSGARHNYEYETKTGVTDMQRSDRLLKRMTGLRSSTMSSFSMTGFDSIQMNMDMNQGPGAHSGIQVINLRPGGGQGVTSGHITFRNHKDK
jgi:DNA-directed RNA polymerase subunit RPC12/RpoP